MESAEEWREFRRECVMMQQYGVVSMPLAPPNPLIELRVPPLLLIKACALLQEVLHEEVLARQIATPAKYHRTLEEDINLLANSVGPLEPYRVELHQVRERRNQAAIGQPSVATATCGYRSHRVRADRARPRRAHAQAGNLLRAQENR